MRNLKLAIAAGVLGLASLAAERAEEPAIAAVAMDYKHFKQMTRSPVFVDPQLAMLCRGASQKEVDEARKKSGPHAHTAILVYMNDVAAEAFDKSTKPFPVGSIVVKEKKGQAYSTDDPKRAMAATPDGVGGMIKRPAGFDPEHGDWEYFYFEDAAKIQAGKIGTCVQCHAGASGTDHVFGSWKRS